MKNPQLAGSLQRIADGGAEVFYTGEIAQAIVHAVQSAKSPGAMTADDLARYVAVSPQPLCLPYRRHKICTVPPPAGGMSVLQILGILAYFDLESFPYFSPDAMHAMLEAEKLAFADRERYAADPAFAPVPTEALLAPDYLTARASLITMDKAMAKAGPGAVGGALPPASFSPADPPSTTHLSVMDADGNAAAMTSSIEHAFGSGIMAAGFLLNNQLTDFSFLAERDGAPVANRIEPGKRPRSAMSPVMVFDAEGKLWLAIGSPGGSRIIPYVTQALLAVLDWRKPLQLALDAPHVLSRNGPAEMEEGRGLETLAAALKERGHAIENAPLNSGLHAVMTGEEGFTGAADPRRDGVALGW